jgi:integrase
MISLGVYPKVSLSEARLLHADARGMLARGVDPSAERRGRRAARLITFIVVARSWLTSLEPLVRTGRLTADTVTDSRRLLERHVLPELGSKPILEITSRDLLQVLKPIEIRGLRHTARRTKQRCSRVFRHAVALGYVPRDVTEDLRGLLEPPIVRRRPCITDPRRLGDLLRAVDGYTGRAITRIGLQLAPLLFVRPGELRKARWRQFDFENRIWRIPTSAMKSRVQHLVPLSRQALRLLDELHELTGNGELLFPSRIDAQKPISGTAFATALRSLRFEGKEVTPHGFRATACTLLNELGWHPDAIERQLAHGSSDGVQRNYNYAQHLPLRSRMMQSWADYLDKLRNWQRPIWRHTPAQPRSIAKECGWSAINDREGLILGFKKWKIEELRLA